MKKSSFLTKRNFFIGIAFILIGLNTISLFQKITRMSQIRKKIPYIFVGYKFSGLNDLLKDKTYISYYTDKDLNERTHALQFAQAQYVLTPTILDRTLLNHEYILFDCSNEETAFEKIKELGVIPIRKNQFGIILAQNPNYLTKQE